MSKLKSQLIVQNAANTIHVRTAKGEWRFQQFKANIIKLCFQPFNYLRNEYLSDAVILKPQTLPLHAKKESALGIFKYAVDQENVVIDGPVRLELNFFQGVYDYNGFQIRLDDNERIYGGGSRAVSLNRRGHGFPLYNAPSYSYGEGEVNLNYSVPFVTSSKGYGLFFDNASRGYFDIGKKQHDICEFAAVSGELNFYLITGTPQTILKSYHELTGTQPLPPRWVLGNLLSRFGYTSQKQVRDIAAKMRKENIPFDAVIFDLFWFGDTVQHTMGNLDWVNKEKWPDPKYMIESFKKENIQSVLITEPFVLRSAQNFHAAEKFLAVNKDRTPYALSDFYFGEGGLLDIFRTDAQNWFWTKYKKQMRLGVEGWWGDLGEPEKHPHDLHHDLHDLGLKRLFGADEVHNLFGHIWTKFLYEKFANDYPSKRLFSLNRSGFAGTQRYSIFPWSGDVQRTWSGYRAQLPVMLGMSMSGVPYMHSDAGGFAGGDGDNELYVRWLQFAVFTPVFRPHGTTLYEIDPNTFSYPSEPVLFDEPYRSIARNAVKFRYELLPYNYTLAYKQSAFGEPLARPLYFAFPSDEKCVNIEDQYMWGDQLMIVPVLHKHETERRVYLPKGEWYRWGESEKISGNKILIEKLSLEKSPVYVKAGSLIPIAERKRVKTTYDCLNSEITWHYYPSDQHSSFDLYDDDGKTKDADKKKLFDLLHLSVTPDGNVYHFKLTSKGGHYRGKPQTRKIHLVVHEAGEHNFNGNVSAKRSQHFSGNHAFSFLFTDKPVHFSLSK